MGRKTKFHPDALKRFDRKPGRKVGGRARREYYLIVCEGAATEPNYFRAIKKQLPPGVVEIEIEGIGRNTLSLIEETLHIRDRREKSTGRKFDHTWAVFDRDSFNADAFDNAISRGESAKRPIRCAWTNEAFELWYLLHLQYVNTGLSRNEYRQRISDWVTQKKGSDFVYNKNDPNMYEILNEYGNEAQAIEWAKKLEALYDDQRFSTHNPRTKVYELVESLNKLKSS